MNDGTSKTTVHLIGALKEEEGGKEDTSALECQTVQLDNDQVTSVKRPGSMKWEKG